MSMPPSNYYGGGPPTRSNSGGCWKAVGITCGLLVILGIVGIFFTVRYAKQAMRSGTGIFGTVGKAMQSAKEGQTIQKAVVQYHTQHGKYPDDLMTLVSDGLLDGRNLHSGLDSDPNPGHISWVYTKPAGGAPGKTPILSMHYKITIPAGGNTQQSQDGEMIIDLDGSNGSSTHSTYHSESSSSGSYSTQTHGKF